MWGIDTVSAYLLSIGLVAMMIVCVMFLVRRSGQNSSVRRLVVLGGGLMGLLGVLLGSVGTYAAARASGYEIFKRSSSVGWEPTRIGGGVEAAAAESPPAPGGAPAGSMGMGGPRVVSAGGGMVGMGMGGGMFGGRGPSPKRDLATTVRKLELLTGQIQVKLTERQAQKIVETLDSAEKAEGMTDEEAQSVQETLLAVLSDEQKSQLEAIGLPFRRGGGFGGAGGGERRGAGGPGGAASGAGGGGTGGFGGGFGGAAPDPDANPFHQETNAAAVTSLRERFGSMAASSASESN